MTARRLLGWALIGAAMCFATECAEAWSVATWAGGLISDNFAAIGAALR